MEPPEDLVQAKQQSDEANQLDRRKISQASLDKLRTDIGNVDDPDAKAALEDIFEILTGKTP